MEKFEYVYSAPTAEERKEIDGIRRQYEERKEKNKLERLRALDARVKNTANCAGVVQGVIGCLIFGLGMTMILEWKLLLWGIIISLIGGGMMATAMPLYRWVLKRNKKKYGGEILRLSGELLGALGNEFT